MALYRGLSSHHRGMDKGSGALSVNIENREDCCLDRIVYACRACNSEASPLPVVLRLVKPGIGRVNVEAGKVLLQSRIEGVPLPHDA